MKRTNLLAFVALLVFAVGCQRHYNITFVNMTGQDLTVTLQGPGTFEPMPPAMPLAREGGRGMFKVVVPEKDLPANYAWHADSFEGSVVVQKGSEKELLVNIRRRQ
jgi:hypothetical protein